MDYCIPGTERFTSFHLCFDEDWLEKALKHARSQPLKICPLVLAIKYPENTPPFQYKIIDGIGGLVSVVGCGDWEPIIREEFGTEHENKKSNLADQEDTAKAS